MTYADLINQWFDKSLAEKDYFTKYIFLYISFMAFLSQDNADNFERSKINKIKSDDNSKNYYLNFAKDNEKLRQTLTDLENELKRQPITNSTTSSVNYWNGTDGVLEGIDDWENIVEFWCRVRNNLFHGHKAPEFDRDKRLVKFAFLSMLPIMQNFIDQNLSWEFPN